MKYEIGAADCLSEARQALRMADHAYDRCKAFGGDVPTDEGPGQQVIAALVRVRNLLKDFRSIANDGAQTGGMFEYVGSEENRKDGFAGIWRCVPVTALPPITRAIGTATAGYSWPIRVTSMGEVKDMGAVADALIAELNKDYNAAGHHEA